MIDKTNRTRLIISTVIELSLAIISTVGVIASETAAGFMGRGTSLLYFTIQSNITISLICVVFAIDHILVLAGRKGFVGQRLRLVKYVFTVAITITFLIYTFFLAPLLPLSYNLSYNNISLHFLTPVLAMVDFFVFDRALKLNAKNCLLGLAMPIFYLCFFLIGIPAGFRYSGGGVAPYFFLNYEKLTWFGITDNGIGVFYWVLIVAAIVVGLCYLFLLLFRLRNRRVNAA